MTSKIRSRIKYLLQTDNILVFIIQSNVTKNSSLTDVFSYDLMIIRKWLTFSGPPCSPVVTTDTKKCQQKSVKTMTAY